MMLDANKQEEILLKTKKKTWVIYNFIQSASVREKVIREMVNYPGTDEGFLQAQYYANIDLFERYIESQENTEQQEALQKELDEATSVVISMSTNNLENTASAKEITSQATRLKKVETLLAKHNIMNVAQRMDLMQDEDFFTPTEKWMRKISKFFRKK